MPDGVPPAVFDNVSPIETHEDHEFLKSLDAVDREKVQAGIMTIRYCHQGATLLAIESGRVLSDLKATLTKHGGWMKFCDLVGITPRTAENRMLLAKKFWLDRNAVSSQPVRRLLKLLGRAVPPEVVEKTLNQLRAGEVIDGEALDKKLDALKEKKKKPADPVASAKPEDAGASLHNGRLDEKTPFDRSDVGPTPDKPPSSRGSDDQAVHDEHSLAAIQQGNPMTDDRLATSPAAAQQAAQMLMSQCSSDCDDLAQKLEQADPGELKRQLIELCLQRAAPVEATAPAG